MQKKCFRILVAALLISALLVVPAFAEGAVVTGSGVNLRSGPGLNYQVVDCLPKGASRHRDGPLQRRVVRRQL